MQPRLARFLFRAPIMPADVHRLFVGDVGRLAGQSRGVTDTDSL